jgi:hypothetical protein
MRWVSAGEAGMSFARKHVRARKKYERARKYVRARTAERDVR